MPTGIALTKDIRTQMTGSEQTVVAATQKQVLKTCFAMNRDRPAAKTPR